MNLWKII